LYCNAALPAAKLTHTNQRELREELSSLQTKLSDQKRELGRLQAPSSYSSFSNNQQYRQVVGKFESIKQDISSTEQMIKSEETPPPPLLQPLPNTKALAMRVIFFLEMPRHFQVLLRLSFMAQQMLLPTQHSVTVKGVGKEDEEMDIQGLIAVGEFKLDWTSYYRQHLGLRSPVSLQATLASLYSTPEQPLGPSNVMSYTSENDGVWHPDSLNPGLWWSGGNLKPDMRGGNYFDPWKSIPAKITENYWVEALPADCRNMQWAMAIDTGRDRGNLALANQNMRPSWLSKPQFLSFASVRAFANIQDRKVCVALHERSLPLEQVSYYLYRQHQCSSDCNFLPSH